MYLWWSLCTLYLLACQVRVTIGDSGLCCCAIVMSKIFWALINSFVCWFCTDLHRFCWFWASFFFRLSQKDHKKLHGLWKALFQDEAVKQICTPTSMFYNPVQSFMVYGRLCFKMKLSNRSAQPQACSTIQSKAWEIANLLIRKQATVSLFSSMARWSRVCWQSLGPLDQRLTSHLWWTCTRKTLRSKYHRLILTQECHKTWNVALRIIFMCSRLQIEP